uniref:CSON002940 protein n=1 Tax=Culicoides sonorensis TaxID=179676 RepID=A0A336LJD1_CULSO
MFWILRRTGAVNLFNSINSNYTSKNGGTFNSIADKPNTRPPRKAYGRLNMEPDEKSAKKISIVSKSDSDFDDVGSLYDYIDYSNNIKNNNNVSNQKNTNSTNKSNLYEKREKNQDTNDISRKNLNTTEVEHDKTVIGSTLLDNNNSTVRLQTISLSDDDDFDESLTCNVCDRAFQHFRQLASHQQKKRHFGCSGCDSLFPSLMLLEHHKEEFEHWSDTEGSYRIPCCRRNRRLEDDDDFYNSDTATSDAESEDMERLL